MFKYSKLILTGIAGIGGGIYLDRSLLNHFREANAIENSRKHGMDDIGTFSAQIFKVFIAYVNLISYEICLSNLM